MDGVSATSEYELVKLVMECQPVATDELIRLCGVRLGLNNVEAWGVLAGLMERQVLVMVDGRLTTRENTEEFQKVMLEAAAEKADALAEERLRNSSRARMLEKRDTIVPGMRPAVPKDEMELPADGEEDQDAPPAPAEAGETEEIFSEEEEEEPSVGLISSRNREAVAARKARSKKKNAKKAKRAQMAGKLARWRVPILIGAGVVVLLVVILVPLSIFLASRYPRTVKSSGRELTLSIAPADKAQQAVEQWIIDYAKGRSSAGRPVFQTLDVSAMKTYEVPQGWSEAVPYGQTAKSSSDPAMGFEGKVVFVSARSLEGEPAQEYDYQYRLYLKGDENSGYTVSSARSGPEAWMEPYDVDTFEADGKTYTLSLCGEEAGQGHCLRMVMLSHGDERQILYLTEGNNIVYDEQHRVRDLNGDGAVDIIIDTQYATQLCYLYDRNAGEYRYFPALSGGQIVSSDAMPGTVMFTDLTEAGTPARFYRWSGDTELTELARLEPGAYGSSGRIYDYYQGDKLVRQRAQDSGSSLLDGELEQNQYTVFNQYMTYAHWDELVIQTAREQGCLALPGLPSLSAVGDEPLSLLWGDPKYDMKLFWSPSGMLMVQKNGQIQVIPCEVTTWNSGPAVLSGPDGGEPCLAVPFFSPNPVLLLARWDGGEWKLTGMALSTVGTSFEENVSLSQSGSRLSVSYNGPGGRTSAKGNGEGATEDMSLSLNLADYIMSVQEDSGRLSLTFPVQLEGKDGSVLPTSLTFTTEYTVPSSGMPVLTGVRLSG